MDENSPSQQEDEISVINHVIAILKHKEFIIKTTFAVMGIAAVVSLIIPSVYVAEIKILPPQSTNSSMASLMASQMAGIGISASALGVKNTNDLYVALLKTHGVIDYVIDKLELMKVYKTNSRESVREIVVKNIVVKDDKKSGILSIGFRHHNPQISADIANVLVEGLQNLNTSLAVTEAGQRRLFFEEQLKNAKAQLISSEESLKSFQQRTGTIKIDDEAKTTMETVASMRAKISAKEVQLRVMRSYSTTENPDLQRLQEEIVALRSELSRLESHARADDGTVPTVGRLSSLGTEYLRRMREFKYNESLYEILMKQYGAAKLDESRDSAVIQIVERAEAPERRVEPQRRRIVSNSGTIAFIFSVLFVFLRGAYERYVAKPEGKAKMRELFELLDLTQLAVDLKIDLLLAKAMKLVGK